MARLLEVEDLKTQIKLRRGTVHAVDGLVHDGAVGDRADDVGVGRRQPVQSDDVGPLVAQDAHQPLAEVAGAAGDEDSRHSLARRSSLSCSSQKAISA